MFDGVIVCLNAQCLRNPWAWLGGSRDAGVRGVALAALGRIPHGGPWILGIYLRIADMLHPTPNHACMHAPLTVTKHPRHVDSSYDI
jgi:hypothetical protein